eukprot:5848468-Prymnesium_polylepis.1
MKNNVPWALDVTSQMSLRWEKNHRDVTSLMSLCTSCAFAAVTSHRRSPFALPYGRSFGVSPGRPLDRTPLQGLSAWRIHCLPYEEMQVTAEGRRRGYFDLACGEH